MKLFNIKYKVAMPIYGSSIETGMLETHIKAFTHNHAVRKLARKARKQMYVVIYNSDDIKQIKK